MSTTLRQKISALEIIWSKKNEKYFEATTTTTTATKSSTAIASLKSQQRTFFSIGKVSATQKLHHVRRDVRKPDVLDDRQDDDERVEAFLHLGGQLLQRQVLAHLPGARPDARPHEEMHDKPTGKNFTNVYFGLNYIGLGLAYVGSYGVLVALLSPNNFISVLLKLTTTSHLV